MFFVFYYYAVNEFCELIKLPGCFFYNQCHEMYNCPLCQCPLCPVSDYFQKYKEFDKSVRVEEIDGVKLVKNLAVKMEEMFRKKAEATRVSSAV